MDFRYITYRYECFLFHPINKRGKYPHFNNKDLLIQHSYTPLPIWMYDDMSSHDNGFDLPCITTMCDKVQLLRSFLNMSYYRRSFNCYYEVATAICKIKVHPKIINLWFWWIMKIMSFREVIFYTYKYIINLEIFNAAIYLYEK